LVIPLQTQLLCRVRGLNNSELFLSGDGKALETDSERQIICVDEHLDTEALREQKNVTLVFQLQYEKGQPTILKEFSFRLQQFQRDMRSVECKQV
jgi:hypothetical protein